MNCISGCQIRLVKSDRPGHAATRHWLVASAISLIVACGSSTTESEAASDSLEYATHYRVELDPRKGLARVELTLRQSRHLLRELRFGVDDPRFGAFAGDGAVSQNGKVVTWLPPERGGSLRWQVAIPHRRNGDGYDAWLGESYGLFRAEDMIPRAATRALKGASSLTSLSFALPPNWSVVTQYRGHDGTFRIDHTTRRFEQPSGWVVMGHLGVRHDEIAGVDVTVAAPVENGARRLDMLALLNWTLPELARIVTPLPDRLTIVSAGDPMWRGGLSAPASLYIHAERPLLSENGTSTLLHEVMHVVLALDVAPGNDWIVEGLAEYYGLELLRRSGTLTARRYERARKAQRDWSRASGDLCGGPSSGATTARAVAIFIALDAEIRKVTGGRHDLDDVVAVLLKSGKPADADRLDAVTRDITGKNPDALHIEKLPGCRKMRPESERP